MPMFNAAIIKEQSFSFVIVIVKISVLKSSFSDIKETHSTFSSFFPDTPIILMAQNFGEIPIFHGKKDIIDLFTNMDPNKIQWETHSY